MMTSHRSAVIVLCTTLLLLLLSGFCSLALCREEDDGDFLKKKLGGVRDSGRNSAEMETLGRFAVQEHNKRENALLEFARVLKATEQVVAGKIYHLTLEVIDAGKKKIYEAKVWVKPWMNFKQLQEFKHGRHGAFFSPSDFGVKQDRYEFGWKMVSTNDLEIQDVANHAVKSIQQRSNSFFPYELIEILQARAKVLEDYAKYELLLKLRRGNKLEKFVVEVMKNHDGEFY